MAELFDPQTICNHIEDHRPMINWDTCIFCQVADGSKSVVHPIDSSYITLEENLLHFQKLNAIPTTLNLDQLCEAPQSISEILLTKRAVWHRSCRAKYNSVKLERHIKKLKQLEENLQSPLESEKDPKRAYTRTLKKRHCLFCDELIQDEEHHLVTNLSFSEKLWESAKLMEDQNLLARLAVGDVISSELKYHRRCLVAFNNRVRDVKHKSVNSNDGHNDKTEIESLAFVEIANMIEEYRYDRIFFRLADMANLYRNTLVKYGLQIEGRVNSTRLKEKLLETIYGLMEYPKGREIYLVFRENVADALDDSTLSFSEKELLQFSKTARILRQYIFNNNQFDGKLDKESQIRSTSKPLLSFIRMLLNGPNLKEESAVTDPEITIAQLITFNSVKKQKNLKTDEKRIRHSSSQETPLAVHIAMVLHSQGRRKKDIDYFHSLGLCISYDRYLHHSDHIVDAVCQRFEEEGVVCPSVLRKGVFTAAAGDNIDENTRSTLSQESFHGNVLSLFQPLDFYEEGEKRPEVVVGCIGSCRKLKKTCKPLDIYYEVKPCVCTPNGITVPKTLFCYDKSFVHSSDIDVVEEHIVTEREGWIKHARCYLTKDSLPKNEQLSWGAFHAVECSSKTPGISVTCPVSSDPAHSYATVKHQIDMYLLQLRFLNPRQIGVITFDQPLYKMAKELQWIFPTEYGEDKLIVMLGAFHIEMAIDKMIAQILESSGWAEAITEAGVFTSGRAEGLESGTNVNRTRYAQEVTLVALEEMKIRAYSNYLEIHHQQPLEYSSWTEVEVKKYPQFAYWNLIISIIELHLILVKSIRKGLYKLYVACLEKIVPYFFALDHQNYARWLSVHIRDLKNLPCNFPGIYKEFLDGKFSFSFTGNQFSTIPYDQANEYNIKNIKGCGGFSGLTSNPAALKRLMLVTPEVVRLIAEYKGFPDLKQKNYEMHHSYQTRFHRHIKSLVEQFEEWGNPFEGSSELLVSLSTKRVAEENVNTTVLSLHAIGTEQYNMFIEERFELRTRSFGDPIKKNKLALFSTPIAIKSNKTKLQMKYLKADSNLFFRLYTGCQNRGIDMDEFFQYETQPFPPSLSEMGNLRLGKKSDILLCLTAGLSTNSSNAPIVDSKIFEGAVLVHFLKPTPGTKFGEYAREMFCVYIQKQFDNNINRIDIVFDVYKPHSLKESTRDRRGVASYRSQIEDRTPVPRNWANFLHNAENKDELFKYLAKIVCQIITDKLVVVNVGEVVLSSKPIPYLSLLQPSNHEEGDTRVILHAFHQTRSNTKSIIIRTVDSDVVVLAVSYFAELSRLSLKDLYIAFGRGNNFRYLNVREIAEKLGLLRSKALLFFHALTGCDTVSSFAWHGKTCAWKAWELFAIITDTFLKLSTSNKDLTEEDILNIERFVIIMYDKSSVEKEINKVRKHLFTKRYADVERLPPSKGALDQHILRAYLQSQLWSSSHSPNLIFKDPSKFGWHKVQEKWTPYWTSLSEASASCRELICCGCKTMCSYRCNCLRAKLLCTDLCACKGKCK